MMICTLASNPEQERKRKKKEKKKRNPFCTTVTSTGHEVGRRLACHLCKRSKAKRSEAVCEAEEVTFVFAKRLKLELKKERKWTPPPETSAEQSWVSHQADVVFVFFFFCTSKMEELFGGNLATCYSLRVTQILYNTYCVVFVFFCLFFFL